MDLKTLIKYRKLTLKPCKTVITDACGKTYEVENGEVKLRSNRLPYVVDTKPDLQVVEIIPGLFLSSQDPAVSLEILNLYKINHILSLGIKLETKYDRVKYYYCELFDLPESDLYKTIRICIDIVHKNRRENILVHCNAGISRSPAVIISYLMALEKLPYEAAYDRVKNKRACVKLNEGFVRQLKEINVHSLSLLE